MLTTVMSHGLACGLDGFELILTRVYQSNCASDHAKPGTKDHFVTGTLIRLRFDSLLSVGKLLIAIN